MDKDTIARLRGLLEKADLPWRFAVNDDILETDMGAFWSSSENRIMWFGNCETYYPTEGEAPDEQTTKFILLALNALPALLSIAERAADVEGMAKAVRQGIINDGGDAWKDDGFDPGTFKIDGDIDLASVSAAVSRYVLGAEA